eukprot:2720374-Pyramimonas_sp.AAC.1
MLRSRNCWSPAGPCHPSHGLVRGPESPPAGGGWPPRARRALCAGALPIPPCSRLRSRQVPAAPGHPRGLRQGQGEAQQALSSASAAS